MKVKFLSGSMFAAVGLLFAIIGFSIFFSSQQFMKTAVSVTGHIDEIRTVGTGDDKSYYVYVSYDFENESYEDVNLGYYSSGMREGEALEIFVNPENPSDIVAKGEGNFGLIFGGFGSIFAILGFGIIASGFKLFLKMKNLKANGRKKYLKIISIERDTSVSVNGRNPNLLICELVDDYTGESRELRSESAMNINQTYVNSSAAVYFDPNNQEEYFIDIKDIR